MTAQETRDWHHEVVVLGTDAGIIVGCLNCAWSHPIGAHATPEHIMDEARAHRSEFSEERS